MTRSGMWVSKTRRERRDPSLLDIFMVAAWARAGNTHTPATGKDPAETSPAGSS